MLRMNFADKLQKLCDDKNIAQSALGESIGGSRSTIADWIGGANAPAFERLFRLSRALGVSLEYLLNDALEDPGADMLADESAMLGAYRRIKQDFRLREQVISVVEKSAAPPPDEAAGQ